MKNLGLDSKILLNVFYSSISLGRRGLCKTTSSLYVCRPKPPQQGCFKVTIKPLSHCNYFSRGEGLPKGVICCSPSLISRHYATNQSEPPEPKPSLYQRFKTMYRDYWYVLLPVHLVTSAAWFGGFYYMASSGVDIVALLESLNVSEKFIHPLRNGHATTGYIAISYALYKIATPLRYTVTLGGTTISINYLKRWGYIKPVPSKEKLKEIYEDKKVIIKEKGQTLKDNMMQSFKTTPNN